MSKRNHTLRRSKRTRRKDRGKGGRDSGVVKLRSLDDTPLPFKKHRGKTPREVLKEDPGYIVWIYETLEPKPCSRQLYLAAEELVEFERIERDSETFLEDGFDWGLDP